MTAPRSVFLTCQVLRSITVVLCWCAQLEEIAETAKRNEERMRQRYLDLDVFKLDIIARELKTLEQSIARLRTSVVRGAAFVPGCVQRVRVRAPQRACTRTGAFCKNVVSPWWWWTLRQPTVMEAVDAVVQGMLSL